MTPDDTRRALIGVGAGAAAVLATLPFAARTQPQKLQTSAADPQMLSAAQFGAKGDNAGDDTAALQAALDAAFRPGGPGFLTIPPGTYKVSRTLRIAPAEGQPGDITRHHGITAHGARLHSVIADGGNVLEIICRSTGTFMVHRADA